MTDAEHNKWKNLKGRKVSLGYDDLSNTTEDGKIHAVIKGTHRARSLPSNDRVTVRLLDDNRLMRVHPTLIERIHD